MKVEIKGITVEVEVANTLYKRIKGLMFMKFLEKNKGMLFVFREEFYPKFWMFGMCFPIDIIWINEKEKIVDITYNAEPSFNPCRTYTPKKKCKYVLEVVSGFAEKYGINIGDVVNFIPSRRTS